MILWCILSKKTQKRLIKQVLPERVKGRKPKGVDNMLDWLH